MSVMDYTFNDIMEPLGAEQFLGEYEGKKPLHLKGGADKFARIMNWSILNDLLSQVTIWSHESLNLILDRELIQPGQFCAPAAGRDGGQVLRPDPAKVKNYLRRGATLVANDIDHLTPELTAFSDALERTLKGKVQGNLYCSSKRRPGFAAHFDTHDVYAVHVEGIKTWHVYEGRAADPIAHPMFKGLPRDHHDKAKGALMQEVVMEPGDLLYLPRGQYHDAIAHEGGAVHIAFGITYPIGADVVSWLFDRSLADPLFRANLPREEGTEALAGRLADLGRQISEILESPKTMQRIKAMQSGFRYPRHRYNYPELLDEPVEQSFRVTCRGVRLVEQAGRIGLVKEGSRQAVEVPAKVSDMVKWVLARQQFSRREFVAAFPGQTASEVDKLLGDLGNMKLTEVI